jgi:hypothetical protein
MTDDPRNDPTSDPTRDARIDVDRFSWPEATLDPVSKMRALAAGLPHVAFRETVLNADFDRVWNFIADLEGHTHLYEAAVSRVRILERSDDRLQIETRILPFGVWLNMDVVLRPGWCVMNSRWSEVGMAAHPEGDSRTRYFHFEGSRLLGRMARPYFRWNMVGEFRRLDALLESPPLE